MCVDTSKQAALVNCFKLLFLVLHHTHSFQQANIACTDALSAIYQMLEGLQRCVRWVLALREFLLYIYIYIYIYIYTIYI